MIQVKEPQTGNIVDITVQGKLSEEEIKLGSLSDFFMKTDIKYFNFDEKEAARQWIKSGA